MRYSRNIIAAIVIIASMLAFTACSKDLNNNPGGGGGGGTDTTGVLLNSYSAAGEAINALLEYGQKHKTDPLTTLYAIVDSVKKFEHVQNVLIEDSVNLVITLKSGIKTILNLNLLAADGSSIFRGGGGGGNLQVQGINTNENKRLTVKNKRILFYCPPFDEFYIGKNAGQDDILKNIAVNSAKDITFDKIIGDACKPSVLKTFRDYGLVIMSTHGIAYGFVIGRLKMPDVFKPVKSPDGINKLQKGQVSSEAELSQLITANNEPGVYASLLNGEMITRFSLKIVQPYKDWVEKVNLYIGGNPVSPAHLIATTKYMEKLPSLDSTIIFGNMCFSGATNNNKPYISDGPSGGYMAIRDAMLNKNPWAYYCYVVPGIAASLPVDNDGSVKTEQALLISLLEDRDTTGNAVQNNAGEIITVIAGRDGESKAELTLFGKDNIWYGCGSGRFMDDRDGNSYKTVCIAGKEWMAEHLRFNAPGSVVAGNNPGNEEKFGRLYSWQIVMNGQAGSEAVPSGVRGICPKGWHIPSAAEFDNAITALGGLDVAGAKMKSTTDWNKPGFGTNESGLNILPAGTYNRGANFGYSPIGKEAVMRSSSSPVSGGAWTYSFDDGVNRIRKTNYSTTSSAGDPWYYSCRCVKDY